MLFWLKSRVLCFLPNRSRVFPEEPRSGRHRLLIGHLHSHLRGRLLRGERGRGKGGGEVGMRGVKMPDFILGNFQKEGMKSVNWLLFGCQKFSMAHQLPLHFFYKSTFLYW